MTEENIFAKRQREQQEMYKRYYIDDLRGIDQAQVWNEIRQRVHPVLGTEITDPDEIRKISDEVKRQYFEYKNKQGGTPV